MKVPLSALKQVLQTEAAVNDIVEVLTQLGHEVDGIEHEGKAFDRVVVGHVQSRTDHPNSDRLGVCMVDVGEDKLRQIVCGAPNVRAGLTVAVALEGACLPGDFQIHKSKIRDVASHGMICSLRELAMGEDHEGIWEMEHHAAPGTPLATVLEKTDVILDIGVTPNRGDCLSLYGLARDLAAAGVGQLVPLPAVQAGTAQPSHQVHLQTDGCKGFSFIDVRGLTNKASPQWLQDFLVKVGLRPRNAVVDIGNYIMFMYGQPLHMYNADTLQGDFVVQDATGGETYHAIGDETYTLNAGDLVIYDDTGLIDLAGIRGSAKTATQDDSTHILIEAAWFERTRIATTGQKLGLQTDARYRFERGIDPQMTVYALQAAATLVQDICGGDLSAVYQTGTFMPDVATITYKPALCADFGGLDVPAARQADILAALGFQVDQDGDVFTLTPPTSRTYMETPEDVVEEILRVVGYNEVPAALPPQFPDTLPQQQAAPTLQAERGVRRSAIAAGFLEAMTYSFINAEDARRFAAVDAPLLTLDNPIDEANMSTMRPSLLPGLLRAAAANVARHLPVTQLFEVGNIFTPTEQVQAAGIILPDEQRHWQGAAPTPDVFAAKAQVERLLADYGMKVENLQVSAENIPAYMHPGRAGAFVLGKTVLGRFGELHPGLQGVFDVPAPVAMFEVDISALAQQKIRRKGFSASVYQPVERDLAFMLDADVPAGRVAQTVQNALKPLGRDVTVFDDYRGQGVAAGQKSLALSFTLQADDRTLNDEDIKTMMDKAITAVEKHYNATLRG